MSAELLLSRNLCELHWGGLRMTLKLLRQSCFSYVFVQDPGVASYAWLLQAAFSA